MAGAGLGADGGEQDQASAFEIAADAAVVGAEFFDDLLLEIYWSSRLSVQEKGMTNYPQNVRAEGSANGVRRSRQVP
ncbi:hypothetical protein OG394_24040 [Kribbella sp. NBC_01245]|uniref:hypothetical protein n=1 Tax=Kribbella sp. NBC_01245 TaxID=2903578 RepID=UPI002E2C2CB4|nr:hypothetical protein [Kribbella sp. NBC_01245]